LTPTLAGSKERFQSQKCQKYLNLGK
jgi:hypothetical protein